jgi:hypothetical protein
VNVTSNLPNYFEEMDQGHNNKAKHQRRLYLRIPVDDSSAHNLAQYFPGSLVWTTLSHSNQ